jgi:transposase
MSAWADMVVRGKTWRDMPGNSPMDQRCLFSLWRRGYLCDGEVDKSKTKQERTLARAHATRRGDVKRVKGVVELDW